MHDDNLTEDVPRRSFVMRATAACVAAVVGLVPAIVAGGFALGPLLKRKGVSQGSTEEDGFLSLGIGLSALPEDGRPQSFTIRADRVDAWNFYPQQPVGKIWLRRLPGDQLIAFNMTCPHLGCDIDYRSAQSDFFCPCHASQFNLAGERQNAIPPRNMDTLATRVVDGQIQVRFQSFRGATPDKVPV